MTNEHQPKKSQKSAASEKGDGVGKDVDIVGPGRNAGAAPVEHALCADGVEIVDVDIADAALQVGDAGLAGLPRRIGGAGCLLMLDRRYRVLVDSTLIGYGDT